MSVERRDDLLAEVVGRGHRVYAVDDITAEAVDAADAIVSLDDPGAPLHPAIARSEKRTLVMRFQDYAHDEPDSPQVDHVHRLIAFAAETKPGEKLLIHCYAGISRSTASMAIVLAKLHPELDYDSVFEIVHRIRPEAWPNVRLVAIADALMKCDGEFVAALQRFRERVTPPNL